MPVAFASAVREASGSHLFTILSSEGLVDERRVSPHLSVDFTVLDLGRRSSGCQFHKLGSKFVIVEKHIRIIELVVEGIFQLAHGRQ